MARSLRAILVVLAIVATAIVSSFAFSSGTPSASAKVTYLPDGRTVHQLRMEVIVKTSNSPYWQLVFAPPSRRRGSLASRASATWAGRRKPISTPRST
jgi:hypothetical protein